MKKILYIGGLLLIFLPANIFGQLSDRVNNPSTLKIGTRPIQGNLGVYFGISYTDIKNYIEDNDFEYAGIPLVSLKYYVTDKIVVRLGAKATKSTRIEEGEIDPLIDGHFMTEKNFREINSEMLFSPGFEYHFTSSNLLDVYVGVLVPLGWDREQYVDDVRYTTGEYNLNNVTKRTLAYGYEGFVGLQAFIADLPVAIGFELGVSGLGHLKDKYKHETYISIGGITAEQTYYTVEKDTGTKYRSLTSKNFETEGNIRITLSYFFNR